MKMTSRRSFMVGTAQLTGLLTAGLNLRAGTGGETKSSNLPIDIWPKLKPKLCAEADKKVVKLPPGSQITLDAANGVLNAGSVGGRGRGVNRCPLETLGPPARGR